MRTGGLVVGSGVKLATTGVGIGVNGIAVGAWAVIAHIVAATIVATVSGDVETGFTVPQAAVIPSSHSVLNPKPGLGFIDIDSASEV